MPVERASGGSSLIDVLDRVLDKGIVIDAWVRISLVGIDLITIEARVVVASIDTYLRYAEAVGITPTVAGRGLAGGGGAGALGGGGTSAAPSMQQPRPRQASGPGGQAPGGAGTA